MNETIMIVILIFLAFIMGIIPVLLIGRGLFMKYIQAFVSGRIIAVIHLDRGGTTFRLCSPFAGASILKYALWGKKDIRSISTPEGSVIRGGLVSWIHCLEKDSAPFNFKKVHEVLTEKEVYRLDEKGEKVLGEDKKPIIDKVPVREVVLFEGYNDSSTIKQLYDWALMRPKTLLSNIPIGMIIIGLVVVVAIIIFITTLSGGASNVI